MENSNRGSQRERLASLVSIMSGVLGNYRDGEIRLPALADGVISVIDSLESIADPAWVSEMRALWWQLEVVNALVLDEARSMLTDEKSRPLQIP